MSLFNINWKNQVTNILPPDVRSDQMINFVTALLKPLAQDSIEMTAFDLDQRTRVKFNGQKIVLQAALNYLYGVVTEPPIYILTTTGTGATAYVNNLSEADPGYVYNASETTPGYVYNKSEAQTAIDFVVYVPASIYSAELERRITASVQLIKVGGVDFEVEQY